MGQIYGAGQPDTDNQNAEALQAALAQRQVTLQGQPQGGSDVPIHQNSDPVSDESEILRSCQPLTGKRRVPWAASKTGHDQAPYRGGLNLQGPRGGRGSGWGRPRQAGPHRATPWLLARSRRTRRSRMPGLQIG